MTVLTTLACVIDANGIHAPAFEDIVATLQSGYLGIYGQDVYLGNDSQDGQWIGILATSINDTNAACVAAYNAFSPSTAQGVGLSRVVKINGIARLVPSNSTCDVLLVGNVGVTITNGQVSDGTNTFNLPASVTIPSSGSITVTSTAVNPGAIAVSANTMQTIVTPTRGWISVNNPAAAAIGAPVESDAGLRSRQSFSTSLPALAIADSMRGAIAGIAGVVRVAYFENNSNITDGNGIPSHSFSFIVDGGDVTAIATAIALRKSPGAGTYGTTNQVVTSAAGVPVTIAFFRPTVVTVLVQVDIQALTGYNTAVGNEIKAAIAAYINALPIGSTLYWTRLFLPANLVDTPDGGYFDVTGLRIARSPSTPTAANVVLAFNEAAACSAANITLTVS